MTRQDFENKKELKFQVQKVDEFLSESTAKQNNAMQFDEFELDLASINTVVAGDYESYTFRVIDSTSTNIRKNLVINKNIDGSYVPFLFEYVLDSLNPTSPAVNYRVIDTTADASALLGKSGGSGSDCSYNQILGSCYCLVVLGTTSDGTPIHGFVRTDDCEPENARDISNGPSGGGQPPVGGPPRLPFIPGFSNGGENPNPNPPDGSGLGTISGGSGNSNPNPTPCNVLYDENCIGLITVPILVETPESIKLNRIASTLSSLTTDQLNYLRSPSNQHVTNAINDYIVTNPYLPQEDKTALLNTIDILRGASSLDVLTTIESHEIFTVVTAQSIENTDPTFFSGLANIYGSLNVHNNLSLSDRTSISIRTFENYGIVKVIKDANPTLVRWTELLFDFNQGKRFTSNHHFVTTLSDIKKIIADNAPRTQEEETVIAFLPGGSLLLDLNTLSSQLNNANPDYTEVTLAVAGILTEFIPWTKLSKAFVKVFDTTRRSFLIFNRTKKHLPKIVSVARGGNRNHVDDANRIFIRANNTGGFNLDIDLVEMEADALRVIENAGKNFISPKDINRLTEVVPTSRGFINASQIRNNAVKIKLENPADAATIQLIRNGQDPGGLSEDIFYAAMTGDGFTAIPRSDLGAFGDQGFDNVLIKRNASGNITDVVINESKQFRSDGSIKLSDGIQGTQGSSYFNCTQMTEDWIDDVLLRMSNTSNPTTVSLGAEIRSFGISNITRSVSGVDRVTGELVVVKL